MVLRHTAARVLCSQYVGCHVIGAYCPAGSHQVQVPLEDILQLAASIMQHLLDHPPMADPSSPPRKQRNRRTAAAEDAHAAVPAPGMKLALYCQEAGCTSYST